MADFSSSWRDTPVATVFAILTILDLLYAIALFSALVPIASIGVVPAFTLFIILLIVTFACRGLDV